ncbi:hypothetical protein [Vibrio nigripulchritudo]|uniref:Uncharacterized protein n=1 Tax=Vibrio nigripulchritudo SOn1 TaxID=1238450 RepID=A0AAV2VW95_9VIBR|nr:hypothetical protein [Vibrio nigripulchritudo]CCN69709.1 hypothetical protein VIBNISFn118_1450005 [Vibrio nigripulchritudo SFn118]CCO48877.1 hypothetical protein VIBNISOn1_680007 [Vibrio nigripulchritudo SOn1]
MYNQLKDYQLDYDHMLFDLEYYRAMLEKINEYAGSINDKYIKYKVRYRVQTLNLSIQALEEEIDRQITFHENISPYPSYGEDLAANKTRLEERQAFYQDLFSNAELKVSDEQESDPLEPNFWVLTGHENVVIPTFEPQFTRDITTHDEEDGEVPTTLLVRPREYDYSNTKFYYADDGSEIYNRFILCWNYDDDERTAGEPDDSGYHADRLEAVYTNTNAVATRLSSESSSFTIVRSEDGKKQFELKKPVLPQFLGEKWRTHLRDSGRFSPEIVNENQYYAYQLTNSRIKFFKPGAFFLYPLDQNEFKTKPLREIADLKAPVYPTRYTLKLNKVVFDVEEESAPPRIYLHCTLPEWNHRLETALGVLEQQINEYKLACLPHHKKLYELSQMSHLMDMHIRMPYQSQSDIHISVNPLASIVKNRVTEYLTQSKLTEELKDRVKLQEAISDLEEGVSNIIENPVGFDMNTQKRHIDRAAKEVWKLLHSKALLAEIKHYTAYIKEKYEEGFDGEGHPAGPYMDEENDWDAILFTISRCYEALSYSDVYREMVWNYDLSHGFDELAKLSPDEDTNDLSLLEVWQDAIQKKDDSDESFLVDQLDALKESTSTHDEDTKSLSQWILSNYETYAKPYLGHVVPGPGAPCTLQVMLSWYQTECVKKIYQSLKSDAAYHVKYFNSVLKIFGILRGDGNSPVDSRSFKGADIVKALIVTRDHSNSKDKLQSSKNAIHEFAKKMRSELESLEGNGKDRKKAKFYGQFRFDSDEASARAATAAYSRVVYSALNVCLSVQNMNLLAEQAEKYNWSEQELYIRYMNLHIQGIMDFGGAANSVLGALRVAQIRYGAVNNIDVSRSRSFKAISFTQGFIGEFLDRLAIPLGIYQGITASYDIRGLLEDRKTEEALVAATTAAAGIMLTVGFTVRMINTVKWGSRIPHPMVSGLLISAGTFFNVMMLFYDLAKLAKPFFSSQSQNNLVGLWEEVKKPVQIAKHTVEAYGLRTTGNYSVWSIAANLSFDGEHDLKVLLNEKPIDTYKLLYGQTDNPITIIEDYHQEGVISSKGVNLGKLSWRAIIPLYLKRDREGNLLYTRQQIIDLVDFDIAWLQTLWFDGIHSVDQVIDYYEEVKARTKYNEERFGPNELPHNLTFNETNLGNQNHPSLLYIGLQETCYSNFGCKFLEHQPIYVLLEMGLFTPPNDQPFYKSHLWQHPHFHLNPISIPKD